jgi:SAM-dependent methyltransferase
MSKADPKLTNIDWNNWLERWDKMQQGYLPWREHSYKIMFDAIEFWLPDNFVALDLACGPGSISSRLLNRFSGAQSIGVDFDSVLLAIGQNTIDFGNDRMTWVKADIRDEAWAQSLPVGKVDVILSSTALHWLAPNELIALYMQLGDLLRPGGLFLNADEMRPSSSQFWPFFHNWSRQAWVSYFSKPDSENWDDYWKAISDEPGFKDHYEEHISLMGTQHCSSDVWGAAYPLHASMLNAAGFQATETLWQDGIERVIIAIR